MALLGNGVDISEDIRRITGQQIEDSRSERKAKRQRLGDEDIDGIEWSDEALKAWLSAPIGNGQPLSLNQLCPEVFQLILAKYLKANNWRKLVPLRLVCKHWRSNIDSYLASRHGFQYTGRVSKGSPAPVINYYEFEAMLSFYPNMRQLIVKNFTVSDHLSAILRHVPNLERLSIYGCRNLSWKGMTILSIRFSHLKFIDVSNCELDENRLGILVENLQNLKIMNAISPGRAVTGLCLSKLGPHIEDIWIGLNHLTDVNPTLRELVSGNGKNLLHLGLIVANYQSTDWSIITDNMKRLKSLKLTFGSYRSGSLKLFAKLKDLEFLVLAEDSRNENHSVLTDDSLMPILRGCSKLKSLAIAGTKPSTCRFTSASIGQIPRLCSNMEQIRFLNANLVTDQTLSELAPMPSLLVLHLSSMKGITTRGVVDFIKTSPKVRNFRISDCPNVTDDVIDAWAQIANNRPKDKFKVYLEGMVVKKNLNELPSNLKMDVKQCPEGDSTTGQHTLFGSHNSNRNNNCQNGSNSSRN